MTNMTDAVAKTIAEMTIAKYQEAGYKAVMILKAGNSCRALTSNFEDHTELADVALNLLCELAGDDAEAFLKIAAKQAKQLKKARKHDAKH